MNLKLARLVVFAILMENGEGIVAKAPDYIAEKWRSVELCGSVDSLLGLLDQWNHYKYINWLATWIKHLDGLTEELLPAPPVEAESVDQQQSIKSESVIKESEDIGKINEAPWWSRRPSPGVDGEE